MKHLLILVVAVGLVAAAAGTAVADDRPGWEFETFEVTVPGYPNPCTGEPDDVTLSVEDRRHYVEHPNGSWHYNDQWFVELWTSSGWSMKRRQVNPLRENSSDGHYVLNESFNYMTNGPDGGKWRHRGVFHVVEHDGELKVVVDIFEDVCVRAPTP